MTGHESNKAHYIIRGGVEGRERLRILARVHQQATLALLLRAGIRSGMTCLDVGCGGGDLAFDLARLVGASGRVVGVDIDEVKVEIAREEARAQQIANIEFRCSNIAETDPEGEVDLVHARFLLSHLPNPAAALARMRSALRPGGTIVVSDTDFRGYFSDPDSPALQRYAELYIRAARRRGADANIGPGLPRLLSSTGFEDLRLNVVQPAGTEGETKLLAPLTMEFIADAVLAEGLASRSEIDGIVADLYSLARDPKTVCSGPRVLEVWGRRP